MFTPTNPEHAAIVERLAQMLAELPLGETVAYETLSADVKRDISGRYRYLLDAAREKAEKNLGCIFECVRTIGVKRLTAVETPDVGLSAIRRVRKAAKRGKKRLDRVNSNSLGEPEQRKVVAYRSMLGAIGLIADGRKAGAVAAVADPAKAIPPKNILQMFQETN